jgi:hypothetical protein
MLINDAYSKYYAPSEHLAVDEVTVFFKGGVIFKQYALKTNEHIGIYIYNLCIMRGYSHDIDMFFRKNGMCDGMYDID